MSIDTNFSFAHKVSPLNTAPIGSLISQQAVGSIVINDLIGPLGGFVGTNAGTRTPKIWKGTGFNLIWRPNFGNVSGSKDFFLQLNMTAETLSFTDITGNGIANRGFLQKDIALGGVSYTQAIDDSFDHTGQHFEPGVWLNVPATTAPQEVATVGRMGSIPHGTTINLQGTSIALTATPPIFKPSSITPFTIGSPDDGHTGLVHFPEEVLTNASTSRTALNRVAALTQAELSNPNLFLANAIKGQTILKMTVLDVTSNTPPPEASPPPKPVPDAGGGTDNIAFLTGTAGGPNANVPRVTATFWIEHVRDAHGKEFDQIQYTQRVLLDFNGLHWPHVTVATLTVAPPTS